MSILTKSNFAQKMTKKKVNNQILAKKLAAKGRYVTEAASAKDKVSKSRLKYKLGKRVAYLASAELADTQNTIRQVEKEKTKRADIKASRDVALGQWINLTDGNPSANGSSGNTQSGSTTENVSRDASKYIDKWR